MKGFQDNETVVGKRIDFLPKAKNACLVMLYGPDLGKRYRLGDESMVIGRAEDAEIFVDKDSVSRYHARIVQTEHGYAVEDLQSTNGTFINDRQFKRTELHDGDLIKTGDVIFKFLSRDNLENIYHEEIYKLATTDGLTTAHNKRFFLEYFERELSRAKRYQRPMSLIILDLDHFKEINDTYGHLAGDYVLKRTSKMIQGRIRLEDVFARYGGEEFALLLPETDYNQALQIAEQLRMLIEQQEVFFEGLRIRVTSSLGVASVDERVKTTMSLIKRADECLYLAKQSGRNRVCGEHHLHSM